MGMETASSLEMLKSAGESSGIAADHAFIASTILAEVTSPSFVATVSGFCLLNRIIGDFSKILTPRRSATARSPRARKAGCIVAAELSKTPARKHDDPVIAVISSRDTRRAGT